MLRSACASRLDSLFVPLDLSRVRVSFSPHFLYWAQAVIQLNQILLRVLRVFSDDGRSVGFPLQYPLCFYSMHEH